MNRFEDDFKKVFMPLTEQQLYELDHDEGMKDCESGKPHKNKSQAYNDGYSAQYAFEQTQNSEVVI